MIPQALSLIRRHFTGEARVKALGVCSAVPATGAAAGQVLGGVLVRADLFGTGGRPVFLVNVPVGLVLLLVGHRVLPGDDARARERAHGLDLSGPLLLGSAVSLLTVPLVLGQEEDWPLWAWLSLAAAVVSPSSSAALSVARVGCAPHGGGDGGPWLYRTPADCSRPSRNRAGRPVSWPSAHSFRTGLSHQGPPGRIPLRTRSSRACTRWPRHPCRAPCPDWYEGVADRIGPAVAESNGRKGARPDGRE